MSKRKSKSSEGSQSKKTKDRLTWTTEMDEVLLNSLLEEQEKGNRVDSTWTTLGLNNVVKSCSEKFGILVDKERVINRRRTLKDNHTMCHDLFRGTSGFAWNLETKLFIAEPEVWIDFLEKKPEAGKWRHTPICHYDKMEALFGKNRASGEGSMTAKDMLRQWDAGKQSDVNSEGNSCVPIDEDLAPDSSKKLKKKGIVARIDKQTEVFGSGIAALTEALKEGNSIMKESRPRCYAEEDVYGELVAIGVPEENLIDCMVYLTENPTKARAMFGVPSALRKEFLLKLMKLL